MRDFNPFIRMPLLAPADGAMSGGAADGDGGDSGEAGSESADSATDGDGDAGDNADDAAGHEGRGTDGEDPDDDDDLLFGDNDQDDARPLEERHKRLSQAHNKLKRRFSRDRTVVRALKDAGVANVQDFIQKSRSFDALLERAGGDATKLLRLIDRLERGEDAGDTRETKPAGKTTTAAADDDAFDFSDEDIDKLWDTTTESGKFFKRMAQKLRDTVRALKSTRGRLEQFEGGVRNKEVAAVQRQWLDAIDAGAKKITDPDVRDVYSDLMKAAYKEAGGRLNPAELSTKILKKLKVNPTQARMVAGAQQQRMAQTNQQRPKHQAGGAGSTATPARGKRESLADVHKRLRAAG